MNRDELEKWIKDNEIQKKLIDGFWSYVENYKKEIKDATTDILNSIDPKCVNLKLHKVSHSLILGYDEFMDVFLRIYYYEDYIATYKAVFTLSGEDADDFLNFEDINYIQRLVAKDERNKEIATIALKEELSPELILRLTGINVDVLKKN